MNLNNISLPSQLIADLYQYALVGDPEKTLTQPAPVPSLGKGGKGVLIVVDNKDVPFLPDPELDFLTKVLAACQLSLADVAIINWNKLPHYNTEAIMEQFNANKVILLDVAPVAFHLPAGLSFYTICSLENRKFIIAPALREIEGTKEAKGQLWAVLKELFDL